MNRQMIGSRPVRVAAMLAAAAVVVPVGATSVASPASAVPATSAGHHRQAAARVTHRLLRASDLGAGWSAVDVDQLISDKKGQALGFLRGISVSPASCAAGLTLPAGYESEAHRVFRRGGNQFGPYLAEVVARFGSAAQAQAALDWAKNKIEACKDLTVATGYGQVSITVRSVGARAVSRSASGYRIDGNLGGFLSAGGQVFAARKGRKIVIVGQGAVGQSSANRLGATRRAAATAFDLA